MVCHWLSLFFLFFNIQFSSSSSSSFLANTSIHLCHRDQSLFLLEFKNTFSIEQAASSDCYYYYPKTRTWKEGVDCCLWDGVNCDIVTGRVIGLDLSCSSLMGSLSSNSSLFLLRHLQRLNLAYNDFNYSRIPPEFGQFNSLTHLNLSYSWFSGQVPSEISYLSKLISLDLSLSGALELEAPTWRKFAQNFTVIQELLLRNVGMYSISASSLLNLSASLTSLNLYGCGLQGLIPASIGNFGQLRLLDLAFNNLTGELPSSLKNLTQLESLSLEFNQLSGSIPDLSKLSKLFDIHAASNSLNGTIPSWLYTFSPLLYLSLDDNQFTGSIHEFQHNSLISLTLSDNKLQGLLPRSIFDFVNLSNLDLSSNNLSGSIEWEMFSKLQNLQYFDLSNNNLSLTTNIKSNYSLPKLFTLFLRSCNLTEFPNFLRYSKDLGYLDLSNNRISGQVPEWMWEVGRDTMYNLNLSHNHLTGIRKLPWKSLQYLDIRSNMLQGPLPVPPFDSSAFLISNNNLTGEIPHLICNASGIEILDLSQNRLTGMVPECIGNFSRSLKVLDLARNAFHGEIPRTFGKDSILRTLKLNGNKFEGPLSRSIANCKKLEVLDLGNNKINDTFPHWLLTLSELKVLILRTNRFHGPIHDYENNLLLPISLHIFDIANNKFSGRLPANYIKNLKAMMDIGNSSQYMEIPMAPGFYYESADTRYQDSVFVWMKGLERKLVKILSTITAIDFSNNEFEGEIPEVIGKLTALKGLNISNNRIEGQIVLSVGNLKGLEWLDLSSNELVGEIPGVLANLTFLAWLNLSHNKLVGPIPGGKQFNTFDNSSYVGNVGLCGFPLSKTCGNDDDEMLHSTPSLDAEEDDFSSWFDWKFAKMGCASGLVIGLSIGYIVFSTVRPPWLVRLTEGRRPKKAQRTNHHRDNGRRNTRVCR